MGLRGEVVSRDCKSLHTIGEKICRDKQTNHWDKLRTILSCTNGSGFLIIRSNSGDTVDAHAPGHARTNVRREHQARTHVRTSEESAKRTVHIQQWGSHPLSLAGRARPRKTICKLKRFVNDLERTIDILCLWYALIVAQRRIALAAAIV